MSTWDPAAAATAADADDPLAAFRERFVIDDPDIVYLDGNSLGRLPHATRERLVRAIDTDWGVNLIEGWNDWLDLAQQAGDVIARLIGARPGEVALSDSTTVNIYKLASAALDARPDRHVVITDDDNFPTDRYVLQGLAAARGLELRMLKTDMDNGIEAADVIAALDEDVALVSLSHTAYRSGAVADIATITDAVHEAGALMLWDLCHSAGSVPVGLSEVGADLAIGCTYKHLNGGPGSPAFLYVRADLQPQLRSPIWGWFAQREMFEMGAAFDPVETVDRFLAGSPPVLSGYGALEGARISAEAGIKAIGTKARALSTYTVKLFDLWLARHGFSLASPRDPKRRGAQVTLHHPAAWQIVQALKAARVVPDFRQPNRVRLGLAPLYTRFADVHEGMRRLADIMETKAYEEFPADRGRLT